MKIKRIIKKTYYFGLRYKCPLCNSYIRAFEPFGHKLPVLSRTAVIGGGYRKTGICPVCDSMDRERLLYLYLLQKTDIFKKETKILHIAPEQELSKLLAKKPQIEYITGDLNRKNVKVKLDLTQMPFTDESFDVVLCCHVLEHIPDDRKALSELYRVLKTGGWGILQVPLSLKLEHTYEDPSVKTKSEREKHFGQKDHVRIYAKDYKERLEEAGFEVFLYKWTAESELFGGEKNKYGLIKDEDIYLVKK